MATALRVGGVYLLVVGILLLIPAWGAAVFGRQMADPAVASGWGVALLALGLIQYGAASNAAAAAVIAMPMIFGYLVTTLDVIYYWYTGDYTARNVLVPIILNVALAIWIWMGRTRPAA